MSAERSSRIPTRLVETLAGLGVEEAQVGPGGGLLRHQVAQRGVAVSSSGVSSETWSRPQLIRSSTRSRSMPSSAAISCGSGSRPSWRSSVRRVAADLVELLDDVDGQAYDTGLLRDAAGDRLAHPPRGVRRELVALGVVELLDRADQAGVALLDQVEHRHRARPYLRAMETTRRRFALMKRSTACGPARPATRAPPGWRSSARRPCDDRRGRCRGGARRSGRPRSSWRARPRWRRRAAGCERSRRGRARRCRGPRSHESWWCAWPVQCSCRPPAPRATTPCRTSDPTPVSVAGFPIRLLGAFT